MDPLSLAIPTVFSALTLALSWIMFHQKIGADESIAIRAELRDCKADIARLTSENDGCQSSLRDVRTRFEAQVEDLRVENFRLMRQALGLDGGKP